MNPRARRFHLRMKPEWNPSQTLMVDGRSVTAAASPYDVPESFSLEVDDSTLALAFVYDFNAPEGTVPYSAGNVRVFRGGDSGRVMRIELDLHQSTAPALDSATARAFDAAFDAVVSVLHELAHRARNNKDEPLRRSVHLGMLEQALPMMGPVIEERLRDLRR